jgi:hypothetical protein
MGSEAGSLQGGSPQPLDVAHGWRAKQSLVFAAEVRGIAVPYAEASACGVQALAEQKVKDLQEQINADHDLSTSLAVDEA